jgi:hypothetical protein
MRVISLTTSNMVPGLEKTVEKTTNLSTIFPYYVDIYFESCKKKSDNFLANRKFTRCYNIKNLNIVCENMLF